MYKKKLTLYRFSFFPIQASGVERVPIHRKEMIGE